jgi:uncharacterized protein with GYD domain
MPKYMVLFGLTGQTVKRFMDNPTDRSEAVRALIEQIGGTLDCYYFMFGQYDGVVIADFPDSATAVQAAAVVTSSGAFSKYETHELISTDDMMGILDKAKAVSYRPPGD